MSEEWQKVSIPDYVKYIGQEKELQSLKAQLKREMTCTDFYADRLSWHTSYFQVLTRESPSNQILSSDMDKYEAEDKSYKKDFGGKLARETVKARAL